MAHTLLPTHLYLPPNSRSCDFFFNSNIITLQCCISFCCTTKWISYMYIYVCVYVWVDIYIMKTERGYTYIYIYILSFFDLPPTLLLIPPLGHHRTPSRALCAIQRLPTSCLFHPWKCVYVNPNLPAHLTLLPTVSKKIFLSLCQLTSLLFTTAAPVPGVDSGTQGSFQLKLTKSMNKKLGLFWPNLTKGNQLHFRSPLTHHLTLQRISSHGRLVDKDMLYFPQAFCTLMVGKGKK